MPELFVDTITSVGAVTAGDNPEALITFWKSRPPPGKAATLPTEQSSADSATPKTGANPMADLDLSALDDTIAKQVTDTIATLEAEVAELKAAAEKPEEPSEEDVAKAADPAVQAILKRQSDEIAELRKQRETDQARIDDEIAKRRSVDFAKRAEPLIPLLGKPSEVGPLLDAIEKAAPAAYAKLEPILKAAAEQARTSDLFKSIGSGEDADTDPIAKRDAWVAKQLQDGTDKTAADLRAEFWKTHPDEFAATREGR